LNGKTLIPKRDIFSFIGNFPLDSPKWDLILEIYSLGGSDVN